MVKLWQLVVPPVAPGSRAKLPAWLCPHRGDEEWSHNVIQWHRRELPASHGFAAREAVGSHDPQPHLKGWRGAALHCCDAPLLCC